jgi:hypothetical protein
MYWNLAANTVLQMIAEKQIHGGRVNVKGCIYAYTPCICVHDSERLKLRFCISWLLLVLHGSSHCVAWCKCELHAVLDCL